MDRRGKILRNEIGNTKSFSQRDRPYWCPQKDVRELHAEKVRRQKAGQRNDSRTYPMGRNGEAERIVQ